MTDDEKFVRDSWGNVHVHGRPLEGCVSLQARFPCAPIRGRIFYSWTDAAEFTRARLEEIRQVEEEIQFVEISLKYAHEACGVESCGCEEPFKRILAREEAVLADLKRGMK